MYRPPHPRMINNIHRGPRPYSHQWRPNHGPSTPFQWNNARFGPPDIRGSNIDEHWCETCDRGFPTAELLQKHKQQHQKCNIDGCQFVAHPKVITKHIQMQHSSGLYKKIANLNNPEDIQKWREERKKKYPTKTNIERKAAESKEKIERGEKMALKHDFKSGNHKPTAQGAGQLKRKHSFDKRNQNQRVNKTNFRKNTSVLPNNNIEVAKKKTKVIPTAPTTTEKNKLKPFTGILNIEMDNNVEDTTEPVEYSNELFEEDYYEETLNTPKEITNAQEPVVCEALTSLMCDYGTSDEETEEKENEEHKLSVTSHHKPIDNIKSDSNKGLPVLDKPKVVENNESDDDGPEEVKIEKVNIEHEIPEETKTKSKDKIVKNTIPPRNQQKQNHTLKRRIPSTLLQKLLHNEIRQERNIVLQCIRYIRKNNYFDKIN